MPRFLSPPMLNSLLSRIQTALFLGMRNLQKNHLWPVESLTLSHFSHGFSLYESPAGRDMKFSISTLSYNCESTITIIHFQGIRRFMRISIFECTTPCQVTWSCLAFIFQESLTQYLNKMMFLLSPLTALWLLQRFINFPTTISFKQQIRFNWGWVL